MNVVLSIDLLRPPLTGIGRYVWSLAQGLKVHDDVEFVRFMQDARWKSLPIIDMTNEVSTNISSAVKATIGQPRASFRSKIGQYSWVSQLYSKMVEQACRLQLKKTTSGIFHGPNYFVPKSNLAGVLTIHDLSMYRYPEWQPKARVERMLTVIPNSINNSELVVTDSYATRSEVIETFALCEERVKVVSLGVDAIYQPRVADEVCEVLNAFKLKYGEYSLFVSTIEPRKNIQNLIRAYRLLPLNLRKSCPLVLAGGIGWHDQEIRNEIFQAEQEGWLRNLGFVAQIFLPILYSGCRLFCYPSFYEGFGLPIVEAMASGVPVVTSNCSSMPEVAKGAAYLIEPFEIESIYEGLQMGLLDDAWRMSAIQKGLIRATELSWKNCVDKTVEIYKQALAMKYV